ncbi:hypothetical protein AGR6A_pAt50103 [Agrobacterium sp. NCPPB 925]|nr:hypothetical protein AGR6A_pAt50103 [Agrobacterium sp. NCPPB 925]
MQPGIVTFHQAGQRLREATVEARTVDAETLGDVGDRYCDSRVHGTRGFQILFAELLWAAALTSPRREASNPAIVHSRLRSR